MTIGTVTPADVIIADDLVQGVVARLEIRGEDLHIADLTGRGIYVNGHAHDRARLASGDFVVLGITRLRFEDKEPSVCHDDAEGGVSAPATAARRRPPTKPQN